MPTEEVEPFGTMLMRALAADHRYRTASRNVNWVAFAKDLPTASYAQLRKAVSGERQPSMGLMEEAAGVLGIDAAHFFYEYELAEERAKLDPKAQGGGEEGLRKAVANLRALKPHDAEIRSDA